MPALGRRGRGVTGQLGWLGWLGWLDAGQRAALVQCRSAHVVNARGLTVGGRRSVFRLQTA
ncbi:hypothetical protein [Acidovorax sp. FJL06]|uniref:hypothetical protein n=1 Tax=Acidovorax sp. FJL06 TaxID=2153365 RepID=UPI000F56107D|nr:hypothetical protein [Acidovorax sp. FJL06]